MNSLPFYIGLGLGLALAAGLRPFLPLLLAGALASAGGLGITFGPTGHTFHFLQTSWWLLIVVIALVLSYALQLVFQLAPTIDPQDRQRRNDPLAASLSGLSFGAGALLFAGTLAAHGDSPWPGVLAGFLVVGLAQRLSGPVITRARRRLPGRASREAVTLYLDAGAMLVAALTALLHPLGYVALALILWAMVSARRRAGEKYAGLRILRR